MKKKKVALVVSTTLYKMWVLMDSNHRSRKTADLQSAPFGHSGKHPFVDVGGFEPSTLCLSDRYSKPAELNVLISFMDCKGKHFF